MNEISPEVSPERPYEREISLTGSAIEGALDQLRRDAPEINLEGQNIQSLEDLIVQFAERPVRNVAEKGAREKKVRAIRRIIDNCRPNNSIVRVVEREGKPAGLVVRIQELKG